MRAPAKILLSAAVVLTAAAIVFQQQSARLTALDTSTPPAASPAAAAAAKPWSPPPRSARPAPEGRLLDKLEENLRRVFTPQQLAGLMEPMEEPGLLRLTHIASLTASEQQTIRARFAEFRLAKAQLQASPGTTRADLAAADSRRDAWLHEFLGPERAALWQQSEAAHRLAQQEKNAAEASPAP
jgi:hypothetical protein